MNRKAKSTPYEAQDNCAYLRISKQLHRDAKRAVHVRVISGCINFNDNAEDDI